MGYAVETSVCGLFRLHPVLGAGLQVYMVRNFGKGRYSEQKVAQLTGILAAASSFSRIFTSMLWGKASDHTGRLVRPSQLRSDSQLGAIDMQPKYKSPESLQWFTAPPAAIYAFKCFSLNAVVPAVPFVWVQS